MMIQVRYPYYYPLKRYYLFFQGAIGPRPGHSILPAFRISLIISRIEAHQRKILSLQSR